MTDFNVTILGAGSATPTIGRYPTAQLLTYQNDCYLIDCGEGTQFRLLELKFRPSKLKAIFISHLHGDHYHGLAPLISSLNMGGRTDSLKLFGPPGLDKILELLLGFAEVPLNFNLEFVETKTTEHYLLFENKHFTVHTIPLNHRVLCAGFLFEEKPQQRNIIKDILPENIDFEAIKTLKGGEDVLSDSGEILYSFEQFTTPPLPPRSYAYCSDTKYEPSIIEIVENVNLLYHEATFADDNAHQAADRYHSTAREAGKIASQAQVKKLLIGHFSSRYRSFEIFLEQAKSEFQNTVIAEQAMVFEV